MAKNEKQPEVELKRKSNGIVWNYGCSIAKRKEIGSHANYETVHKHDSYKLGDATIEHMESSPFSSDVKGYVDECEKQDSHPKKSLFKNWPLMSSVIVYCIFSLHDMAYTEIFSLWAVSDKSYGGLSFSSQDVGEILAISGLGLLVYQLLVYPSAEKLLGPIKLMRAAAALSIPLLAAYPFMAKLSGLLLTLIVNCASLMKNVLSVSKSKFNLSLILILTPIISMLSPLHVDIK
ncbi:hypothetical protein ZIOFF_050739 [Zingiber officinale]|uniref:Uncharacterized protein n=1 Tax=Zingiber officinale TaxID=94328 RepID=A0A8J5FRH8_ZINOF|nr:hypothetical protein ZIOFF_050739 [Zingiber officinale]